MLAVIDHNHRIESRVALGQDGAPYSQAQVSRRLKQWVAYEERDLKISFIFQVNTFFLKYVLLIK